MIKRIVLTEDGNKMLIYDMGDTLQFVCEGKKFNIKKEKVMSILNEENRTYYEIINDGKKEKKEKKEEKIAENIKESTNKKDYKILITAVGIIGLSIFGMKAFKKC